MCWRCSKRTCPVLSEAEYRADNSATPKEKRVCDTCHESWAGKGCLIGRADDGVPVASVAEGVGVVAVPVPIESSPVRQQRVAPKNLPQNLPPFLARRVAAMKRPAAPIEVPIVEPKRKERELPKELPRRSGKDVPYAEFVKLALILGMMLAVLLFPFTVLMWLFGYSSTAILNMCLTVAGLLAGTLVVCCLVFVAFIYTTFYGVFKFFSS